MTNENEQPVPANADEPTERPTNQPTAGIESPPPPPSPPVPPIAPVPPPPPVPPVPPVPTPYARSPEARRERRRGVALGAGGVLAALLLLFGGFALGHWAFPEHHHGGHHGQYGRMERRGMSGGFFGGGQMQRRNGGNQQPQNPPSQRGQNNQRPQGNNQSPRGNGSTQPRSLQDFLDRLQQSGVITKDQEQGIQNFLQGLQR